MTTRQHWPVIIVGAGPTGLTLAGLLARYGIDVLLIERNPQTVQEPRAVSIDDELLRTMQSVGIINELVPHIVLGYGSEYFSPSRRRSSRSSRLHSNTAIHAVTRFASRCWSACCGTISGDMPTPRSCLKPSLSNSLSRRRRQSCASSGKGAPAELSCDFLVGCDGSRSFVRQTLGIEMHGSTFRERWLIVDIEDTTDPSHDTKVYCIPERPCLSLPGPSGTRRFEFMLHDGEQDADVLAPDNVAALLRLYGTDDKAVLRRKVVYTFHARMADRWRAGRVFLAGDAAHLTPPFAGQGMNSGVRDAHNLAWKLAAVVSGHLGDKLLDSYEAERRDHAAEMIQLAIRMGQVMMPRGRWQALAFQTFFRALALYPAARSYFAEMKYKPKPRFHRGFLLAPTAPSGQSLVGKLFPQALVMTASGFTLLDDVLGDGFALLAPPGTPPNILARGRPGEAIGPPIRAVAVLDREDTSAVEAPVIAARDLRGDLARLLAGQPAGLYLLRPDRYVAAFFPVADAASAPAGISRLTGETRSGT